MKRFIKIYLIIFPVLLISCGHGTPSDQELLNIDRAALDGSLMSSMVAAY